MKTKIKKQLHGESNHYDPHDNNPIFNAMPIGLADCSHLEVISRATRCC